jgi:hypothetical protein
MNNGQAKKASSFVAGRGLAGAPTGRDSGVGEVTVAELVAELKQMAPQIVACVVDDQGFPHEITRVRYRTDLDMVTIELGSLVSQKTHVQKWNFPTTRVSKEAPGP